MKTKKKEEKVCKSEQNTVILILGEDNFTPIEKAFLMKSALASPGS